MKLRKLNEQGLRNFREFLQEARADGSQMPPVPTMLLTLPITSEEIVGAPDLEQFTHITRYELARYLQMQLDNIDSVVIEGPEGLGDPGFWGAWRYSISTYLFRVIGRGQKSQRPTIAISPRRAPVSN